MNGSGVNGFRSARTFAKNGESIRPVSLVAVLAAIALLGTIYAVHAEDAKGPSEIQQDRPPQEQPDTMKEQGTISTGHVEIDSNVTRPRTQDDVIREILSSQPSDKHRPGNPVPPR
jgi:hypothetical protein